MILRRAEAVCLTLYFCPQTLILLLFVLDVSNLLEQSSVLRRLILVLPFGLLEDFKRTKYSVNETSGVEVELLLLPP